MLLILPSGRNVHAAILSSILLTTGSLEKQEEMKTRYCHSVSQYNGAACSMQVTRCKIQQQIHSQPSVTPPKS
jgi:hypothetical protein